MTELSIHLPNCSFHSPVVAAQRRSLLDAIERFNRRLPAMKSDQARTEEIKLRCRLASWISKHRLECQAAAYDRHTMPGSCLYEEARRAHHDVRPEENQRRINELKAVPACQ